MKLPTDRYVLEAIFNMYESSYPGPVNDKSGKPENDPYVAIDVRAVAKKIECRPELLFGRLYYHLDPKYRYRKDDGSIVSLFQLEVGGKRHLIQFPLLSSILAGLNQEYRRVVTTIWISAAALVLSSVSLLVSFFRH